MPRKAPHIRKLAFLCFEGFQLLDLTGPLEVFALAHGHYQQQLFSTHGGAVRASSGVAVQTEALQSLRGFDSLIIVGGRGIDAACADDTLVRYIAQQASKVKRLISICSGAFLLAKAQLLTNRQVTTHWSATHELARLYPALRVVPDAIFVKDGNIITSAGVTAGMDLALAVVEEDVSREVSMRIARELVIFYRRPGGQTQFSELLKSQSIADDKFSELCGHIHADPGQFLSVAQLAEAVHMSERNFSRRFTSALGIPPGKYLEKARVAAVKRGLETSNSTLAQLAHECGFHSLDVLRRAFMRQYRVTPADFQASFGR